MVGTKPALHAPTEARYCRFLWLALVLPALRDLAVLSGVRVLLVLILFHQRILLCFTFSQFESVLLLSRCERRSLSLIQVLFQ